MTIASKLQLTLDTKQAIKQALIAKGAEPTDVFSTYPALIEDLASGIATPEIISPVNGASGVDQSPIITASEFAGIRDDGTADSHAASIWEFASDSGFTNIIHASGRDTTNLTSYDLQAEGISFGVVATVHVRVTYEGGQGKLSTSRVASFTTTMLGEGGVIDGDIVVGQLNGEWILVAPATSRVMKTWGLGASYCSGIGYSLPSLNELLLISSNAALVDDADPSVDGSNTQPSLINLESQTAESSGGSTARYAWSSQTLSDNRARILDFKDGDEGPSTSYYADRSNVYWVLPVRRISA